ncbi:sugar nucleotide-binding protein [Acidaminobacter sp. JC074]|uniref:sugar nucleotide-binding protein n=1 Tax=Acidaminobacter sp. JC074 TaxID=2530199 RepID=UPI001F106494|nr:sugar nucleotide-binding protein [Acidaminobacter sp. JC074]MCH4889479.1 sugar nucleotide-binding protein [Acidaminobacter sp. JC074]
MKAIITGMNGTLAPYVYDYFESKTCELIVWERQHVPIDDPDKIKNFISEHQPDIFLHIATGPVEWIKQIIDCISDYSIPLVFISSEAVFNGSEGPHTTADNLKAKDDYGRYKIHCESIINKYYKENTYIIRLGWQIAYHTHKNNMLAFLVTEGHVKASEDWILATSFMPDTAKAIYKIIKHHPTGTYHLDSNQDNMSFYELVCHLKEIFKLPIDIEKTNTFKHNNRLLSDQPYICSLKESMATYKKNHGEI